MEKCAEARFGEKRTGEKRGAKPRNFYLNIHFPYLIELVFHIIMVNPLYEDE
jgi:hypothetical protein